MSMFKRLFYYAVGTAVLRMISIGMRRGARRA
jgi:hypothetical protein